MSKVAFTKDVVSQKNYVPIHLNNHVLIKNLITSIHKPIDEITRYKKLNKND